MYFINIFMKQEYYIMQSMPNTVLGSLINYLVNFQIDTNAAGEYLCTVKWGTIFIRSTAATLKIRTISVPPQTTNVAKGGDASFPCQTTGDAAATITFHKTADNSVVGTVTTSEDTAGEVVTTTGILTISGAQESNSFEYYCKASWGGVGNEVTSDNVYLSVLGVTDTTSIVWGVATKSARFECKSDANLKKNAAGDNVYPKDDDTNPVGATSVITWQYYDETTSDWKESTEDDR